MSSRQLVQFQIDGADTVQLENPNFNPLEPEDPIFNRRYHNELDLPSLTLNREMANNICFALGYPKNEGRISFNDLEAFERKCVHIQNLSLDVSVNAAQYKIYATVLIGISQLARHLRRNLVWK